MACDQLEMESQRRLEQASLRITELEESLTGKQTAFEQLLAENEELKSQISLLSSLDNVVCCVFNSQFYFSFCHNREYI